MRCSIGADQRGGPTRSAMTWRPWPVTAAPQPTRTDLTIMVSRWRIPPKNYALSYAGELLGSQRIPKRRQQRTELKGLANKTADLGCAQAPFYHLFAICAA